MKSNWDQFISSVMIILIMPLLPLAIEYLLTSKIDGKTYTITVIMYSASIGASTKSSVVLFLGFITSVLFSAAFGFLIADSGRHLGFEEKYLSLGTIIIFMMIHTAERYFRHVIKKETFFSVGGKNV